MRIVFSGLWLVLAAGWFSCIVSIARLIGGAKYFSHMGQSATVAMLGLMGALCVAAVWPALRGKPTPRLLAAALGIVAGVHLLNAVGIYILSSTNGRASPAVMLPFVVLSAFVPTSTTFIGMPAGLGSIFVLPASTLLLLVASTWAFTGAGSAAERKRQPLFTLSRIAGLGVALAVLFGSYLGFLKYRDVDVHRPRQQGEPWMLLERERHERADAYGEKLREICRDTPNRGIAQSPPTTAVGIRVVEVRAVPDAGARGWESGLAFFLGGETGLGTVGPATVIEGLQNAVRRIDAKRDPAFNPDPLFIEYQAPDGRWKRYARQPGGAAYAEQDALDVQATRGLKIAQLKTGFEATHLLYGGSLEFTDLATGAVVVDHKSFAMDQYYGAHNNFALIPAERCSGLPHQVDFVTNQLAPHFVADAKKNFMF